ncbi:MAG: DUF983 domain-containing protein [Acidimicrobiales bacterium]
MARAKPVSKPTLVWRAVRRRCPQCGCPGRELFARWFKVHDQCPRCGLRSERVEGHWIGSVGINTILSFAAMGATLVAGFVLTYPRIAALPIALVGLVVMIGAPLVLWPFSRTLWMALDLMMNPAEKGELDPRYEL